MSIIRIRMFQSLSSLGSLLQLSKRLELPLLSFVRYKPFPPRRVVPFQRSLPITDSYSLENYGTPHLSFSQAIDALRAYSLVDIDELVNLRLQLNFSNPTKKKQLLQPFHMTVEYPRRVTENAKVFVLCHSDEVELVKESGARGYLHQRNLDKLEIEAIEEHDFFLATEVGYDSIRPLGKLLRAKMPNRRKGSVVKPEELSEAVSRFHATTNISCMRSPEDRTQGVVEVEFGKLSFSNDELLGNMDVVLDKLREHNVPELEKFVIEAKLSTEYGPTYTLSEDLYFRVNDISADSTGLF